MALGEDMLQLKAENLKTNDKIFFITEDTTWPQFLTVTIYWIISSPQPSPVPNIVTYVCAELDSDSKNYTVYSYKDAVFDVIRDCYNKAEHNLGYGYPPNVDETAAGIVELDSIGYEISLCDSCLWAYKRIKKERFGLSLKQNPKKPNLEP